MSKPRIIEVGQYYHVYSRGVNRCNTYSEEVDYYRFKEMLELCNTQEKINFRETVKYKKENSGPKIVIILCYCLMPNHFHMIIQEITDGGISLFLQKVLSGYVAYFNKKYNRTGALFGSRFKNKIIDNDIYFNHLITYIKNNPVKLINSNYKSEDVLDGSYVLTKKEQDFAKKYPHTYLAPTEEFPSIGAR